MERKFITQYTIYCTPEQTKKAIELGAEVDYVEKNTPEPNMIRLPWVDKFDIYAEIPTTEQMIGWLEEREEISDLHIFKPAIRWTFELYTSNGGGKNNHPLFNTRKDATLAAIDAALEYLERQKK